MQCRRNPVPAGLLLALTLGSAVGLWHLSRLNERLVQSTALEGAAQQAEMLEGVNDLYSDVVERVKQDGVPVTHDYVKQKGAIPLPARMTIDLAQHINKRSESGVQVRLYSDYPFKFRTDGGAKDDFERDALARLRENPDKPVYRFEDNKGRPTLPLCHRSADEGHVCRLPQHAQGQHQIRLEGRGCSRRCRNHPSPRPRCGENPRWPSRNILARRHRRGLVARLDRVVCFARQSSHTNPKCQRGSG